mmetsp:Transcript_3694/g.7009  ORF Transcript_3694/g.7009 Transcript_3694/m.7009 type:complete len:93 (+) Transcript_3694:41-319(+)|eukprot:CAMPEP_0182463798 /NCGR_PEP_ID=MMETSP1319-20130603/7959_1 /TAXON_ID=172717 /ORGANISM="Bolidomonas pacifica, Strain RCC208" /LENGTH=92 /DNA_ID=CAMNT_0024663383 /DNA_START=30 /DNA_END=311 /DNA_ORIENTATION=-
MGISTLAVKLVSKSFVGKAIGKGVIGMSLLGNALLPKFMRNALHIKDQDVVVSAAESVPIYLDFEVWLLLGLICYALVVTQEKKEKKEQSKA